MIIVGVTTDWEEELQSDLQSELTEIKGEVAEARIKLAETETELVKTQSDLRTSNNSLSDYPREELFSGVYTTCLITPTNSDCKLEW